MTPTREQVLATTLRALKDCIGAWYLCERCGEYGIVADNITDAIMFLLAPKPPARRWIELPPMPSMEQLEYVYGEAYIGEPGGVDDSRKAGIAAVLKACGLEVEEAKR